MTYVYQEVNSGDHGVQGRAAAGNLAPETQMAAGHLSFWRRVAGSCPALNHACSPKEVVVFMKTTASLETHFPSQK